MAAGGKRLAGLGTLLAGLGKWLAGLGTLLAGIGKWLAGLGRRLFGWLLVVLGMFLALGKWLKFLAALGALVVGGWLLVKVWQGPGVAAAFTRVGGETHVETAVEASRFWVTPPRRVVTVGVGANQATMLGAAQCAMAYDAPLLFRSQDKKREHMVDAVIASWGLDPKGPDVISVDSAKRCLPHKNPADVKGLSAYGLPGLPLPRPRVAPARDGLAPVVVFAAARAPRYPPDIAVGLALAAHMAKAYGQVSLVAVPRYEEASSNLNNELRNRHGLVKGGVILGDPNNLSEDTRALLRQLLTSTNEQAVLGEIRTDLGFIAPFLVALAGLFAAGMEPKIGENVESFGEKSVVSGRAQEEEGRRNMKSGLDIVRGRKVTEESPPPPPEPQVDWLKVLDEDQDVTVWLRDKRKFAGTVDKDHLSATVLRLKNVVLTDPELRAEQTAGTPDPGQKADVLLLFEDIQLIIVRGGPPPKTPDTEQPNESVGSHRTRPTRSLFGERVRVTRQ